MSIAPAPATRALLLALVGSVALLGVRLHVALGTGFGDSEALYASYALHPQPAYLDHPGLIGLLMRCAGNGAAPRPWVAHLASSLLAGLVPWVGALAAWATGADRRGMARTALALLFVPELAVGLFGLTPDLPLALLWLGALGLGALALRRPPASFVALLATLGASVLIGLACLSKLSGLLLGATFLALLVLRERRRLATVAPWAALAVALILLLPLGVWEARHGLPMLRHRLIDSQALAGFSLRNLGALLGGQLAYVTPPFLWAAGSLGVDLFRRRREDTVAALLWLAVVIPALPLTLLCLWSKVAEPHWVAPAYLALTLHLARSERVGRRLGLACVATGVAVIALAWLWVRTPLPVRLLGASYRARYDLANDLYAWQPGGRLLVDAVERATLDSRRLPVVVGPHWIVCAQAHALLGPAIAVGCNSPRRDDFDDWLPRERWLAAPSVVYVHDSRFDVEPERELPGRVVRSSARIDVRRGGTVVRTIWVTHLELGADTAQRDWQLRPSPGQRAAPRSR